MIAHFIGGPAHGRDEAISGHPHRIVKFPELNDVPYYGVESTPYDTIPFIEHEYKLLYTDARLAVYQWLPPRVEATWEFSLRLPRALDIVLQERLHNLTPKGTTLQMTSCDWDGREVHVRGAAIVDGPPDGTAAKQVGEDVQSLIDRKLRGYRVSGVAVQVGDG